MGGQWEFGAGTADKTNLNPGNGAEAIDGLNWMTNLATNHGVDTQYVLESPPFSLVGGAGDYFLEFDYRAIVDTGAGMSVESSIDGGNSWQVLGSSSSDTNIERDWYTAIPGEL